MNDSSFRGNPIVGGFHLIWTAYGWWLPNDPRGSTSTEIRVEQIAELGPLHTGRKPVQPMPAELRAFYEQAASVLKHDLLQFDADQRNIIGNALGEVIERERYTCYACAVMPDHVHCLIRKHKHHAEDMIANMQDASREALKLAGKRSAAHPVWGGPGWKVFLYSQDDFRRVVKYIEDNPRKARMPDQSWKFVKPYDGWLPGNPAAKR